MVVMDVSSFNPVTLSPVEGFNYLPNTLVQSSNDDCEINLGLHHTYPNFP